MISAVYAKDTVYQAIIGKKLCCPLFEKQLGIPEKMIGSIPQKAAYLFLCKSTILTKHFWFQPVSINVFWSHYKDQFAIKTTC